MVVWGAAVWPGSGSAAPVGGHLDDMAATKQRLQQLRPVIEKLMKEAGTAGLSYGVLHRGHVVHAESFGYRDVDAKLPVTENTIFHCASLTKAPVAAGIGALVEAGYLSWHTLVKDVLPELHTHDELLHQQMTVTDILSHRSGMSTSNYWLGSVNNILIQREDILKFVNDQHLVKPFRGQFQYNNLGYETAGLIIEKLSKQRWSQFLEKEIISPLGLKRTGFRAGFVKDDDDVTRAYCASDNGKPTQIDDVKVGDDTFGGANAGMRSTVMDLLALYRSLLVAGVDQLHGGGTATKGSPFKQTSRMLSAQIPLNHTSYLEHSYAMGLARVQLPNHMGEIGLNPKLMPAGMPVVGKGAGSHLVIYHQGSFPGTLAAINLLPETQSAIVVLTNTLALNDCADWVGQLLLETLLNTPQKNDYVAAARSSVQEALKWGPRTQNELDELKGPIPPRALSNYTGVYLNGIGTMEVTIILDSGKLYWTLQGLESETYELHHLNKDVFHWYPGRNELAVRGKFTNKKSIHFVLRFDVDEHNHIGSVNWVHDPDYTPGETYWRKHEARL